MLNPMREFDRRLTNRDRRLLAGLDSPARIQAHLDRVPYVGEERYRSPLTFLRERGGHCFDGAVFAAFALRRLGHPARLVDILPNHRDDDHVLAVYRRGRHWGALAKSNFTGIRSREPVYGSLRELVMSYFEGFFNVLGERTMRAYAMPVDLARFDRDGWPWNDAALDLIGDALGSARVVRVISSAQAGQLTRVDPISRGAGLLRSRPSEMHRPD